MTAFKASCSMTTDWTSSRRHTLSRVSSTVDTWVGGATQSGKDTGDAAHSHRQKPGSHANLFGDDMLREVLLGDDPQRSGAGVLIDRGDHQGAERRQDF